MSKPRENPNRGKLKWVSDGGQEECLYIEERIEALEESVQKILSIIGRGSDESR